MRSADWLNCRYFAGHTVDNLLDRNELQRGSEQWNNEQSFHQPTMGDGVASFSSDGNIPYTLLTD